MYSFSSWTYLNFDYLASFLCMKSLYGIIWSALYFIYTILWWIWHTVLFQCAEENYGNLNYSTILIILLYKLWFKSFLLFFDRYNFYEKFHQKNYFIIIFDVDFFFFVKNVIFRLTLLYIKHWLLLYIKYGFWLGKPSSGHHWNCTHVANTNLF